MSAVMEHTFTAADDAFHDPGTDPWFTETCWFSFNVPERNLGCWLYAWVRPNLGNAGGGAFVWDDSATNPWDLPYYTLQHTQPLPRTRDLRRFTFPQSFSVEMLEPLARYRLTYRDRDRIRIDTEFTALTAPHAFAHGKPPFHSAGHFDQPGRIVGEMALNGEAIAIDCYSVRDRSWGPRLDHKGSRVGYPFGVSKSVSFCCFALPNDDGHNEPINHGYYWRDGVKTQIAGGVRHVERDPVRHWPTRMVVDATDASGRRFKAVGEVKSRMFLPMPRGVTINSFITWSIDGDVAHGEDQDVWRYDQWYRAQPVRRAS